MQHHAENSSENHINVPSESFRAKFYKPLKFNAMRKTFLFASESVSEKQAVMASRQKAAAIKFEWLIEELEAYIAGQFIYSFQNVLSGYFDNPSLFLERSDSHFLSPLKS